MAGPLLGPAAHRLRRGTSVAAGVDVGLPAGILVGEGGGVYGLRSIADTMDPPYCRFEIACGLALLCLVGVTLLRRPAPLAAAGFAAVAVAAVFVALYGLDLLRLL